MTSRFLHLFHSLQRHLNVKVFLLTYALLTLYEYLGLRHIWTYDPGSNPKYNLVCNIGLVVFSLLAGYLARQRQLGYYLPSMLLPVGMMAMEWVNFQSLMRFDFYAQLALFILLGSVWTWLCHLLLTSQHLGSRCQTMLRRLQTCLEALFLLLIVAVMINAVLNGGINYDAIVAICQTNFWEAWHYFWGLNHGLLLCALLLPLWLGLTFAMCKLRRKYPLATPDSPTHKCFHWTFAGVLLLFAALCFLANFCIYFTPLTWRTLHAYRDYYHQIENYQKLLTKRHELTAQFLKQQQHRQSQGHDGIFVLVIGESLDRRYMGCYNPRHQTTPFQTQRRQAGDTIFFDKAYACHVQTTRVLPMMLTFYNQYLTLEDYSEAEQSLSLIDIARSYGYHVYWFSNQEKMSNANSIISSLAFSCDTTVFMRDRVKGECHDETILEALAQQSFARRSLVIIHLAGNHYPYGLTYPQDFAFPHALDTYEKSVYYNDWVLQRIAEFFADKPLTLLAYVSDHADAVSAGKGHDPRPEKFLKEMVEIPLWFHFSPRYRQACPQLWEQLQSQSHLCVTNDLMFNLFQQLMGLDHTFSPAPFSPLEPDYILKHQPPLTLDRRLTIENP